MCHGEKVLNRQCFATVENSNMSSFLLRQDKGGGKKSQAQKATVFPPETKPRKLGTLTELWTRQADK